MTAPEPGRTAGEIDSVLFGRTTRQLSIDEIATLEAAGCEAEEWGLVRVADGFHARDVKRTRFDGFVVLGSTGMPVSIPGGPERRSGIENAWISNSEIGNGVLVRDVRLIHDVIIEHEVLLIDCAEVSFDRRRGFVDGMLLRLVCDPGGRVVPAIADWTYDRVARAAMLGDEVESAVREALRALESTRSTIGKGSIVRACGPVRNCRLLPGTRIEQAAGVTRSTLLSGPNRPVVVGDGAIVRDAMLHGGVRVSDAAVVERALVFHGTSIKRHALVAESVIGAGCVISGGEISKSLLGPLTGFHHQALLVATTWPDGRGNVGYGAMVGANHTGRRPDQELVCGEGVFFGLGVNVRFPADLRDAPYSLFAAGVQCLPQRMDLPFSLVASPRHQFDALPAALNEIRPGWLLAESPYTLARNESKYRDRYPTEGSDFPDLRVFRPRIMKWVVQALDRLEAVPPRPWYTEQHLPGLGKCYLVEEERGRAIVAYRESLRWYGLRAVFDRLDRGLDVAADSDSNDPEWTLARDLLGRFTSVTDPDSWLRLFLASEKDRVSAIEAGKRRDDERGTRVIRDYGRVHGTADTDAIVVASRMHLAFIQTRIAELTGTTRS